MICWQVTTPSANSLTLTLTRPEPHSSQGPSHKQVITLCDLAALGKHSSCHAQTRLLATPPAVMWGKCLSLHALHTLNTGITPQPETSPCFLLVCVLTNTHYLKASGPLCTQTHIFKNNNFWWAGLLPLSYVWSQETNNKCWSPRSQWPGQFHILYTISMITGCCTLIMWLCRLV